MNIKRIVKFSAIGFGALIILFILIGVSGSDKKSTTQTQPPQSEQTQAPQSEQVTDTAQPSATIAQKQYQEVFAFSGNGAKKSEPFTIQGDRFKIAYDCNGDPDFTLCQAFVYKVGSSLPELIMNSTDPTKDETIIYGRGEYYIDANIIGNYTMTVYDYK